MIVQSGFYRIFSPELGTMRTPIQSFFLLLFLLTTVGAADLPLKGLLIYQKPPATYTDLIRYNAIRAEPVISTVTLSPSGIMQIQNSAVIARLEYPPDSLSGMTSEQADAVIASAGQMATRFPQFKVSLSELANKWQNAKRTVAALQAQSAALTNRAKSGLTLKIGEVTYENVKLTATEGSIARFEHSSGVGRVPISDLSAEQIGMINAVPGGMQIHAAESRKGTRATAIGQASVAPAQASTSTQPQAASPISEALTPGNPPPLPVVPAPDKARDREEELVQRFLRQCQFESISATVDGDSALHRAIWHARSAFEEGSVALIRALLARGANVNAKGALGRSPLHNLGWRTSQSIQIATILLETGADPNARSDEGDNLLSYAVASGSEEGIKLLLSRGAQVNLQNKKGQTALFICALPNANRVALAQLLVESGAQIAIKDSAGQSPLHCAAAKDAADLAELLIRKGAPLEATDNDGRTALHIAASESARDTLAVLLGAGADAGARDKNGSKPAYLASIAGSASTAESLATVDVNQHGRMSFSHEPPLPTNSMFPYSLAACCLMACAISFLLVMVLARRRSLASTSRLTACLSGLCGLLALTCLTWGILHHSKTPDAKTVLKNYLEAARLEERLKFVCFPQRVRPLMMQYYPPQFEPHPYKHIDSAIDSLGNPVLKVAFKDGAESGYYIRRSDGAYAVDWEASVGWSEMSGVDFDSKKPSFPVRMRCAARLDTGYVGTHSDGLLWMCVRITCQDGHIFSAYARRASVAGEVLATWLGQGGTRRVALDLKYDQEPVIEAASPEWIILN